MRREIILMLVRVMYQNQKFDFVKPFLLDELLYLKRIKKFLRSEGWATLGINPMRGTGGSYEGPERRRTSKYAVQA